MRVTIRQKNLDITPALRVYVDLKLVKPVSKLLSGAAAKTPPILDLELGRLSKHHKKGKVFRAEANLSIDGTLLRAEVEAEDIRLSCDLLKEELEREILTFKERARAKERRTGRLVKKDLRFDKAARLYRKGRIRNEGN